ncbi:hypothetical protein DER45DRAFT_542783 [Fusarium avenaceum]|nr:hypothetical protein DER45DRAFT_542783 [Fusarium avenaceum]
MLLGIAQTGSKAVKYSSLNIANPRGVGPVTGAIWALPRLVITGCYFHGLTKNSVSNNRTAAILGEVSNLSSYVFIKTEKQQYLKCITVTYRISCNSISQGEIIR